MLALLLLPALLGLALFMDDGDDDTADDMAADPQDDLDTTTLSETDTSFTGDMTDQRITGNDLDNTLSGGGGDDVLVGNAGADILNGDAGNDTVYGGSGNDTATGNAGDDLVFLGAGADEYTPGDIAATGDDAGDDTVNGGVGDDVIVDLRGANTLTGSGGDDILSAIDGLRDDGTFGPDAELSTADILRGGSGNDALVGDDGDEMAGGTGDDTFFVANDEARAQEAVVITDFNVNDDSFAVLRFNEMSDDEEVTFTHDPANNAVRAFFNGTEVAVLNGVAAADMGNISVAVFDEDDYTARLNA